MTFFPINNNLVVQIQQNVFYQLVSDFLKWVLIFTCGLYFKFFKNQLPAKVFLSFIKSHNKVPIYVQNYINHDSFDERIQAPLNDIMEFLGEFNKRGDTVIADSKTKLNVDWNNGFVAIGIPQYNPLINNILESYPELFYVPSKFLNHRLVLNDDSQISSTSKDFIGGSGRKGLGLILKVKNPDTNKMCLIISGNSINTIKIASGALNKYWRYLFKRYGSSDFGCVFKSYEGNSEVPILINASKPKINIFARLWFFIIGSIISIGSPKVNISLTKEY